MAETLRLIIIEDLEDDALLLVRCLKQGWGQIHYQRVDNASALRQALKQREWDLVLSDFNMPGFSGRDALGIVSENQPDLPFIIVSGTIGDELAVSMVKAGASDYVMKDNLGRLVTAAGRALREAEERKQYRAAQLQLKHSERKFRSLFEGAGDAVFFYEQSGRILEVNHVACHCTGRSREELLMMNVRQLIPMDLASKFAERMKSLQQHAAMVYESSLLDKQGKALPVEVNSRLMDYQGQSVVLSILRDISDRKLAADALRGALHQSEETRDKITAILRSVVDGLIVIDNQGKIVLINRKAEELLRVDARLAIGQHVEEVIMPQILVEGIKSAQSDSSEVGIFEWESAATGQKDLRIIQAGISLVMNQTGINTGVVAILRDITREHELDRMKSEFVTIAAHELSTPLATIMGFTELLINQDKLSREVKIESLQYIYEKTEELEKIVDGLLNLSRSEFGLPHRLVKRSCILNECLENVISRYRQKSPAYQFEVSLPDEPMRLVCDREGVSQVLDNLLSNAIKFSPPQRLVKITAIDIDDRYRITVEDQGQGMRPEQVKRVFEKFYRVDNADTAVGGFGLGMSISESIVRAHGGEIWVKSEVGKGTTVTFEIPKNPH